MFINLGLSGVPFVGADIGGYAGDYSEELLIRWMQLGAFTPLFRNHSRKETHNQEPWQFGEKAEKIITKFINLRYKLLPYFYNAFREAYEKGYPILRPMFFDFEGDRNTYSINDQFMIGKDILVAPVYLPGQNYRAVYLPEGKWYDYCSNKEFEGGQHIIAKAEIDSMPTFIKAGAIIPEFPVMNYVGEKVVDELTLNIYGSNGEFVYYEDDGENKDYIEEKFNKTSITTKRVDGKINILLKSIHEQYNSSVKRYRFVVKGLEKAVSIAVNGDDVGFKIMDKIVEFTLPAEKNVIVSIKL